MLLNAEIYECLGVLLIDTGGGEGGVDCGMARVDLAFLAHVAQGEHAFLDGADSVQPPLGVHDGLGALFFGEGFGGQTGEEIGGENLVSEEVLGGQNYDAGGEPWRSALRLDLFLPASLRGPVLSRALRRLDSIWTTFNDVDMISLSIKAQAETPTLQPN